MLTLMCFAALAISAAIWAYELESPVFSAARVALSLAALVAIVLIPGDDDHT